MADFAAVIAEPS